MPGRQFKPSEEHGHFVGLCMVSSSRGFLTLPGRISAQLNGGATLNRATGRAYNGHTALMCGRNGRVRKLVGWDPESSVEAFVKSTVQGYDGMAPVQGAWGDDVGMDADPTALFFGVRVSQAQYEQFHEFLTTLDGRSDFGPALAEAGVTLKYAFKPNEQQSSNPMEIVANCGDAAFHVLAQFLYEWGLTVYVSELRAYILQNNLTMNFSQGMLMRWAS